MTHLKMLNQPVFTAIRRKEIAPVRSAGHLTTVAEEREVDFRQEQALDPASKVEEPAGVAEECSAPVD
jgi:hypothetical protein